MKRTTGARNEHRLSETCVRFPCLMYGSVSRACVGNGRAYLPLLESMSLAVALVIIHSPRELCKPTSNYCPSNHCHFFAIAPQILLLHSISALFFCLYFHKGKRILK